MAALYHGNPGKPLHRPLQSKPTKRPPSSGRLILLIVLVRGGGLEPPRDCSR
jgi:hypothetical protein